MYDADVTKGGTKLSLATKSQQQDEKWFTLIVKTQFMTYISTNNEMFSLSEVLMSVVAVV